MSDEEIKQYLLFHNFQILASDGILDIFNTSYQIVDKHYDPDTGLMTIRTPDNTFTFLWILGNGKQKGLKYMITLYRAFKLWQLRTKWRLAMYQFIDQQATELLKNPEEIEKKFVSALAEIIHAESNKDKE